MGDPILVAQGNSIKISAITKIKVGGRSVKHIDGADLQNDNTVIECKQLDLTEVSDDLLWQGGDSFIGDSFSIEDKYCSSFQPDVTILDGKAYQKFNKSLMFDFGVQLQFSSDSPSVTQVAHSKQSDSDLQKACYCYRKM